MSIENFDKDNFKKDFKEYFSFRNTIDDYTKKINEHLESVKEELEDTWHVESISISCMYNDDLYINIRVEAAVINYEFFKQLERIFDANLIKIAPYNEVVQIKIILKKEEFMG